MRKIMWVVAIYSFATLIVPNLVEAQAKRDIQGFKIGMSLSDLADNVRSYNVSGVGPPCSLRSFSSSSKPIVESRPGDGREITAFRMDLMCGEAPYYHFYLTAGSDEKILKLISYTFRTPLNQGSLGDLVESVSKQFSVQPISRNVGCGVMCTVANWSLPDQLFLTLETYYGCCKLILGSNQIENMDSIAVREKRRKENPAPRF